MPNTRSQAQAHITYDMAITADTLGIYLIEALKSKDVVNAFMEAFQTHTFKLEQDLKNATAALQAKDTEIQALKTRMDAQDKKLADLEFEVDSIEQHGRKPSVRVFGVPESDNETHGQLEAAVLAVFAEKLRLPAIEMNDLEVMHRLGPKPAPPQANEPVPRPRGVIVRFHHRKKKQLVFQKGVLSRLKGTGYAVMDDFSKRRAAIYAKCREKVRKEKIKESWTTNGKILIKDNRNAIRMIKNLDEATAL